MRLKKFRVALAAALLSVLLVSVPAHAQVPTNDPNQPLAALINGTIKVPLSKLDDAVNRQLEARKAVGDAMPADMRAFKDTVLNSLIEQALIEEAARIQGLTVTDAEVDKEIQDYVAAAGGREKWLAIIATDRMTEAQYRAGVREALITNRMRDIVTRSIGPTAEMIHARHILVADQNAANTLFAQLKANGDFAKLAAQFSLDQTTKQSGGDLGWFPRGQLLQKSVEDAAFALQINEISAPVKSDLGYHILQVLERDKAHPLDPGTRARLQAETFETWVQTLVKQAAIVKYPLP